jgi:acetyl esterase
LAADLSGLPACHIAAAEMDPLCDNSPALAEKLDEAGVANTLNIYPGVLHGFLHLTRMVAKSRQALDDAGDAIAAGL